MIGRLLGRKPFVGAEEQAYQRLAAKGYRPAAIIDVGAYEGNWTRLARRVFPGAESLMVEPQAGKAPLLERVAAELPGTRFVSALLADAAGREVTFYEMETGSSMMPENSDVSRREVRLTTSTLDEIAADLPQPTFLKIDAQGAELQILAGAERTIPRCDASGLQRGRAGLSGDRDDHETARFRALRLFWLQPSQRRGPGAGGYRLRARGFEPAAHVLQVFLIARPCPTAPCA
jgi:FkbM family methyltransferase